MGVDYYTCQNCKRNFPECVEYFTCTDCESNFCSDECGGRKTEKKDPAGKYWNDLTSCVLCRHEIITDAGLVVFLLNHLGITRSQAEELFRRKNKPTAACTTCNANPPGPRCPLKCDENH